MTDDPAKPPRFPYIAALLCAACLGAAVWTWMRYSYAWPMDFRELPSYKVFRKSASSKDPKDYPHLVGRYVSLVNIDDVESDGIVPLIVRDQSGHGDLWCTVNRRFDSSFMITPETDFWLQDVWCGPGSPFAEFPIGSVGRVCKEELPGRFTITARDRNGPKELRLDTYASRFHGASIAGFVVGAMGVFVFTVALRHWLGERRRLREEARA